MLILPRRLSAQPRTPARIDGSHPAARGLIFSASQAESMQPEFSRRIGYPPLARIQPGSAGLAVARGGIGWSIGASSTGISSNGGASVSDVLVELAAGKSWTFQVVVDSVGATGSNPGFWRVGSGASPPDAHGDTFVISEGAARRPWVRLASIDLLRPTTGSQWVDGQQLNLIVRCGPSATDAWWDGKLQHAGSGAGSMPSATGYYGIFNFGTQYSPRENITGQWQIVRFWDRYLADAETSLLQANPWALLQSPKRRVWVPAAAGGGGADAALAATGASGAFAGAAYAQTSAALNATGGTGAFSATANSVSSAALVSGGAPGIFSGSASSPATATLGASGGTGSFAGTASSPAVATLAATGNSGDFSAVASSPAVSTLSVTGASGAFAATANTTTTATLSVTGNTGAFSGSASTGASATVAVTGASGTFSGIATAPASVALAALGGEGAFAGSAYPLTSAQVAALGASGAFAGSASTVGAATLATTGGAGSFAGTANSITSAALAALGSSGAFAGSASVAGTGTYPNPATVLYGITYGPTGADYTGTFVAPSAAAIAAEVLAAMNLAPPTVMVDSAAVANAVWGKVLP